MTPPSDSSARIDKWLWSVRLYKTRSQAASACRHGHVLIDERSTKPARDVHVGEQIVIQQGLIRRTVVVLGLPVARVGAALAGRYCEERTPASEWMKAREQRVQHVLARARGTGRPTKRDRRALDRVWEGGAET